MVMVLNPRKIYSKMIYLTIKKYIYTIKRDISTYKYANIIIQVYSSLFVWKLVNDREKDQSKNKTKTYIQCIYLSIYFVRKIIKILFIKIVHDILEKLIF